MGVTFKDQQDKVAKLLVVTSNQICLENLHNLAGKFWHDGALDTSSRVNSNGGYLMFFSTGDNMLLKVDEIKQVTEQHDPGAKIIVYNYQPKSP